MIINGTSETNIPAGQMMGINQAMDSYSRNIQNQIANAQKQLQELSSNEEMTLEEKMKKRQEIQQQISDLNMQLRQHQMEQRKEKQAKGVSMDDMLGGTKGGRSGGKSAGLSQAGMTAMISADTAIKQSKVQGSVAAKMEGRAGILESEIKLDETRGCDTTKKREELADAEQTAMNAAASQMGILGDANKALKEAAEADGRENKASEVKEENAKDGVSKEGQPDSVNADRNRTDMDISEPESVSDAEVSAEQQNAVYAHVDVRL